LVDTTNPRDRSAHQIAIDYYTSASVCRYLSWPWMTSLPKTNADAACVARAQSMPLRQTRSGWVLEDFNRVAVEHRDDGTGEVSEADRGE
jgi:hypothetical protein